MPFAEFGRPKANLNMRLDRDALQPGDEVEARLELMPREDFHVRLGKVELVRVETCVQTVRHQYGVSYHKKTHATPVGEETFLEDRVIRRMGGHRTDVRFVLPPDALPSLRGSVVGKIQPGISWEVRASLDVTRARDMRQIAEVEVARPLPADDTPQCPVVAEAGHRQCALTLDLSRSEARSGDSIDGSLRAEMLEDVDASEVRVELVRVEKFGNESQDHVIDKATFERGGALESGERREWRFTLDVGHVGAPSLETEHSSVKWLVKGTVDRRMRRDLRVEREIGVDF